MAELVGSEAPDGVDGESRKGFFARRKGLLIGFGGAVVLLAIVGGAWKFGVFDGNPPPAEGEETAEAAASPAYFVNLPDITVNLTNADQQPHFLRVSITLEVADSETVDIINDYEARIQDVFQIYLRELRATDLDGSAGMYRLKEELLRRINLAIAPARVEGVLFRQVLIQ